MVFKGKGARSLLALGVLSFSSVAWAQFGGQICTPVPSATTPVPAPGSGSISIEPLSKFSYPAQVCISTAFTGTAIKFDYAASLGTRFNNASFPSNCAGVAFGLNGGPVYSYTAGTGNFALNLANPSAAVTGTMQAISYSLTENLTLSAGGASFTINTDLLQFKSFVTINADQSTDVKICTPRGGVSARVNGDPMSIPTSIWQCLAAPTPSQPNVRIVYEEGC